MHPRGHVGAPNLYAIPRRAMAGAPILQPGGGRAHPMFALASGATPALVPDPAQTGVDVPLPMPPIVFSGAGTASTTAQPQGWYRPRRYIVGAASITAGVTVNQIFVGIRSCIASTAGGIPSDLFSAEGVDCGVTFFTAGPSITISVNVTAPGAVTFTSAFLGAFVDGASGGTALVG
jgi:hypothetical protein